MTSENLEICLRRGVYGLPKHEKLAPEARGLADICGIGHGSQILLYEIGTKAIYGIYKAKSFPFARARIPKTSILPQRIIPSNALRLDYTSA